MVSSVTMVGAMPAKGYLYKPTRITAIEKLPDVRFSASKNRLTYPAIRNLVVEGGGIKVISAIGALKVMEERGERLKRVAGTSAGAIVLTLLACGYTVDELKKIMLETNFGLLLEGGKSGNGRRSIIRHLLNLRRNYGWHNSKAFHDWLGKLIEAKLGSSDATFKDLQDKREQEINSKNNNILAQQAWRFAKIFSKNNGNNGNKNNNNISRLLELYIIASNMTQMKAKTYSYIETPNTPIRNAVVASMSIPFIFECARDSNGDILSDGGVMWNYPLHIFDDETFAENPGNIIGKDHTNMETLGIIIKKSNEKYIKGVTGSDNSLSSLIKDTFHSFAHRIVHIIMETSNNRQMNPDDWQRTITIDMDNTNISAMNFDISSERKEALMRAGGEATESFLSERDNKKSRLLGFFRKMIYSENG